MPMPRLFDTHTHFDVEVFDFDREQLAYQAKQKGVDALVLIGFQHQRFHTLIETHHWLNGLDQAPRSYLAPGLHPFYIEQHQPHHLDDLKKILEVQQCIAVGEIGLDTFLKQHKQSEVFAKQQDFFAQQLDLAQQFKLPVLLHIRKSHAEALRLLKAKQFVHGGIAHAFSGGIEEAKAFIQLGFKLGVTGQITNSNAKKLHQTVQYVGIEHLVIETDCPDMTPLCCQASTEHRTRNTPQNLIYVLEGLAHSLNTRVEDIAQRVWENSVSALNLKNELKLS